MHKPELLEAITPYTIDDYFYFTKPMTIRSLHEGLLQQMAFNVQTQSVDLDQVCNQYSSISGSKNGIITVDDLVKVISGQLGLKWRALDNAFVAAKYCLEANN